MKNQKMFFVIFHTNISCGYYKYSNDKCRYYVLQLSTYNLFKECGTVSSMLSGLETRSLGQHIRHNVVSSLVTVCPCRSSVHPFLGLTSTKQGVNVTCSRPQRTATGRGSNHGPLGPKSDALTIAPEHPLKAFKENEAKLSV